MRFEFEISCLKDSNTMFKKHINQKLKLMVEGPGIGLYSDSFEVEGIVF